MKLQKGHKSKGIYIFWDNSTCLYIGKSKSIPHRIKQHMGTVWGLRGRKNWRSFFKEYQNKNITVQWIEIDYVEEKISEYLRIIYEDKLTENLKPIFIPYQLKINNRRGYSDKT